VENACSKLAHRAILQSIQSAVHSVSAAHKTHRSDQTILIDKSSDRPAPLQHCNPPFRLFGNSAMFIPDMRICLYIESFTLLKPYEKEKTEESRPRSKSRASATFTNTGVRWDRAKKPTRHVRRDRRQRPATRWPLGRRLCAHPACITALPYNYCLHR